MQYDRKITISAGNNRRAMNWTPQTMLISELWARLRTPARGTEPLAEYLNMKQQRIKTALNRCGTRAGAVFLFPLPACFPLISAFLPLQHFLDKALHTGGAGLFHAFRGMGVTVHRKSGAGVAQIALNGLYIIPRPDGVHGVCMPERMKMEAGQTSGGKRFSKTIVGPPLIKRRTGLGGEYQAIGVIPQWPRFQLRF